MKAQLPEVETVVFNGIEFRRYPNAKRNAHRRYYSPSGKYIERGVGNLHVEIWKAANGPVPDGYHVHHRDGDPLNNDIDNLECLSSADHFKIHASEISARMIETRRNPEMLARIQAGAAEWHRSDEGRAWHSEHGKRTWENRQPVQHVCEQCGVSFESLNPTGVRFCSSKCKQKWRRAAGVDNIERACEGCGKAFVSNKNEKVRFCSLMCARHSRFGKMKCQSLFDPYDAARMAWMQAARQRTGYAPNPLTGWRG